MIVSMAIANKDEQDLPSGHKRKKEGDVIAVKSADWQWGTEEVKRYLIVRIDFENLITSIEDAQKLTVPQFQTGELWYPSFDLPQPKIIGKRRYKIPFTDLTAKAQTLGIFIDMVKVQNETVAYQPLEKTTIHFTDIIYDKILGRKITNIDLITVKNIGK